MLHYKIHQSRKFSSVAQSCLTLCDAMDYSTPASLSITNSRSLLKLMSIELAMPSNHLILCRPLLLPPSNGLSIRVFSNESVLHIRRPKCWNFSFSISPSNEYLELIWNQNWFPLGWISLISLLFKGLWRVFSSTAIWKHQFFRTQPSLGSNSHIHTGILEK